MALHTLTILTIPIVVFHSVIPSHYSLCCFTGENPLLDETNGEMKTVKINTATALLDERLRNDSVVYSEGDLETSASDRRKRRKTKSKYGNVENDDDLEKMLKWKNGIGHLPGNHACADKNKDLISLS